MSCPNENHSPYWVWWNNFIKGYKCKQCYHEKYNITSWNKENIINFFEKEGYELLDLDNEWKSVDDGLSCKKGDYFYYNSVTNLKKCIKENRNSSLFKDNIYAMKNLNIFCENERPDYKVLSNEYTSVKDLYKFEYIGDLLKENICPIFETTLDMFYHGRVRHPQINKTKMEEITEGVLIKHNIKFISQWTKHSCINPKTNTVLRFDIAILDKDNKVYKILELDGESHYMEVEIWGGKKGLEEIKYRDEIKNEYCQNKNIELIRLPYWDLRNISKILIDNDIV